MRLLTFTFRGVTRIGAMAGDSDVIDLARAAVVCGAEALPPADMLSLLNGGESAIDNARKVCSAATDLIQRDRARATEEGVLFGISEPGFRIEAPVPRPGKVLAIGLNYKDHAAEAKAEIPKLPVVFSKLSSCIIGPRRPILRPKVSKSLDWEGEFCFVIGKRARHVAAKDAKQYVAGYAIGHDVSVRDWQFHSSTWMMGKGFDTHGPMGPWLVTPDEAGDVDNLELKTWVNEDLKQHSNTSQLIFGVGAIIEYVSKAFTLEPGDVVFTGTPSGVGATRRPPQWLQPGDVVRISITGLGVLENPVAEEP
jgi:2-keto-4-pentenoate hydratase/2-oxohepta-3-ene-1,7-dioic acid hydratase in catechol pathway